MNEHDTTTQAAPSTGQVSGTAAEVYEQFFVPALFGQWPDRVLDLAGLVPGDAVLDVGCGTGVAARAAVRRGAGEVHGVDPNPGMLDVARSTGAAATWHAATAEALPFDDHRFDRVVSQFAAMFFTDRTVAVSEMARVCRPGGSVAIATWAAVEESPGYLRMIRLLDELFGPSCADALRAPFCLGTSEQVRGLLHGCLGDVAVTRLAGTARFASITAWVHTDVRGWTLAERIDDEQYQRLLDAATVELADLADDRGRVEFAAPALVGVGLAG